MEPSALPFSKHSFNTPVVLMESHSTGSRVDVSVSVLYVEVPLTAVFLRSCRLRPPADVIHTVGPVARGHVGKTQRDLLSQCYQNSLSLAKEHRLRTVARDAQDGFETRRRLAEKSRRLELRHEARAAPAERWNRKWNRCDGSRRPSEETGLVCDGLDCSRRLRSPDCAFPA
ncbi:O-acetyl-ADP-ribose deacetylase MACROD2-like isoform X1, partial [Arapaima gigas]